MNRIEKLIQELCPNGVEFKEINALVRKVDSVDWQTMESARYIDLATVDPRTSSLGDTEVITEKTAPSRAKQSVTVGDVLFGSTRPLQGRRFFVDEVTDLPFVASTGYTVLRVSSFKLDPRFLFHWLGTDSFVRHVEACQQGTSYPAISDKNVKRALIPVPPIEVQREIVKILDLFTELEAELEARRKQYEHYRDELLCVQNENRSRLLELREVVESHSSGATPRAGLAKYYDGGTVPWLRTNQVRFNRIYETDQKVTETALAETAVKWVPEDSVIVAISGATAGRVAINKIPLTTNQHCLNLQIDPSLADYRFVFYWLSANYEKLKGRGRGARADLNSSLILSFPILLPSFDLQRKVADVLDKFDALVNDLSSGLPAEIEARRKQYEYYRDKLLTFKELQPEAA